MTGQDRDSSAFNARKASWPFGTSSSEKMASTGHSGSHSVQSMHSSGSMTRKFGPSWKQSTGQTSTQSVYLQRMQFSTTTKGMAMFRGRADDAAILPARAGGAQATATRNDEGPAVPGLRGIWRSLGDSNPCSSLERAVS